MKRKIIMIIGIVVVIVALVIALKVLTENKSETEEGFDVLEINKKIMLNECSVEILKMTYSEGKVDLYHRIKNTDDSFVSHLVLKLYNEDGKKYSADAEVYTRGSDVGVLTFSVDEAFVSSATIKIEAYQANVTNIIESLPFSLGDNQFEYEGHTYTLNLTNPEEFVKKFEITSESEDLTTYPLLAFKNSTYGWFMIYYQKSNILQSVDQALMNLEKILEIGITSRDEIEIITESIEVDLK